MSFSVIIIVTALKVINWIVGGGVVSVINKQNLRTQHELEETKNAKSPQIHIVKSGKTIWFLPADDLQHNSKVSV